MVNKISSKHIYFFLKFNIGNIFLHTMYVLNLSKTLILISGKKTMYNYHYLLSLVSHKLCDDPNGYHVT